MRTTLLAAAVFALTAAATAADAALAGTWVVETVTRDGKVDDGLTAAVREHAGDKYTVTPKAGSKSPTVTGTFTAADGKIDMKPASGRYKDKTLLGIYKISGDTLTIAFAEPGKDRPTAYESKEGSGVTVAVHKKK